MAELLKMAEALPETLSQLATELYLGNYIFDFATQYYWSHPAIKSPDQLLFSDKDYDDFKAYLTSRNFSYNTITEQSFKELVANAKKEKYYDIHKDLFTALEKDITHDLAEDLKTFKNEIVELLTDEIIGRFFYEDGAIKWTIKTDDQVLKAINILNNKIQYGAILKGSVGPIIVADKDKGSAMTRITEKRKVSELI
jgi:carboxyl-terminal processing protease